MKYWAVSRCLGLTDAEFWMSTLAKITALYQVRVLTWDRTRDFYLCQLASLELNGRRIEESQKVWTPEELLALKYPPEKTTKQSVTITQDLDRGARGNWRELKGAMKGITTNRERKNRKRRVFNAKH